jgi:fructose-1,6-bisphosphatase/inositol monophosphatase family enzyme
VLTVLRRGRSLADQLHRKSDRPLLASAVMDSVDDLQLAFDTSDLGAELALAHFESGVSATLKADGTPVTEADRAVERLLRETLSEARPEDAFLGEELGQLGESDRVWILDPIDGTGFFSRGDPNWRIHIALEVHGTTEVALVASPALRRCWWATRGGRFLRVVLATRGEQDAAPQGQYDVDAR